MQKKYYKEEIISRLSKEITRFHLQKEEYLFISGGTAGKPAT